MMTSDLHHLVERLTVTYHIRYAREVGLCLLSEKWWGCGPTSPTFCAALDTIHKGGY